MPKPLGRPPKLIEELCTRIEKDYIESGKTGDRLPPENKLSQKYGASRGTVRSALQELEKRRTIYRKASRGAFVADRWTMKRMKLLGKQVALIHFRKTSGYPLLDAFFLQVADGLHKSLSALGLNQVIVSHSITPMTYGCESIHSHLNPETLAAGVLLGPQPEIVRKDLGAVQVPLCAVDWDATQWGIDSFCFDNRDAGRGLARRLHRLGHRRFAVIAESPEKGGGLPDPAWRERHEGLMEELKTAGCPQPNQILIRERGLVLQHVAEALKALLKRPSDQRPTALILPTRGSVDPWRAMAAEAGLRVPQDLTVAGFGGLSKNIDMSGYYFEGNLLGVSTGQYLGALLQQKPARPLPSKLIQLKGRYHGGNTHARSPQR